MRSTLVSLAVVILALAISVPLFAQETADICLGGGLVARLRDRGAFASVAERAANVDQKLVEIVSYKDTQHPQVTVKQKGNLWTVYGWEIPVVSVYPSEAKTNAISEKQLAQMWAKNLQERLPKATPCSKLPPEQLGYGKKPATATTVTASTRPVSSVAAKPAAAKPPAGTPKPATTTPTPANKPAAVVPASTSAKPATAAAKPAAAKPVTLIGSESGAVLLIVDAMRAAREMNDQDWAARKEATARELYSNLLQYLTGSGTPPKAPATTAPIKPATTTKPATVILPVTPKPATPVKPTTTAKPPASKPATTATTTTPTPPAADASMEKVPQKNRWRAKFAAAKPAYDALVKTDPEAAQPITEMLSASRTAFAAGNFDEAEKQIDAALAALGVTFKE